MASGNQLFSIDVSKAVSGPATLAAAQDTIAGTSTPAEVFDVLAFDETTQEYADFKVFLPAHYDGGGLTFTLLHGAGTATGGITWQLAIRRIVEDAEDLNTTAHTYDYNEVDISTLPSASGEFNYDDITFTNGADMDGWAAGEWAWLRATRNVADANDTAAADGWLLGISCKET